MGSSQERIPVRQQDHPTRRTVLKWGLRATGAMLFGAGACDVLKTSQTNQPSPEPQPISTNK